MNRLAVVALKNLVRLFPQSVRNVVKKNNRLMMMYRRSLSLHGFIAPQDWDAVLLYRRCLQKQQAKIDEFTELPRTDLVLSVIVTSESETHLTKTLRSIQDLNTPFRQVVFITSEGLSDETREQLSDFVRENSAICLTDKDIAQLELTDKDGGFVVFSGDILHPDVVKALSHQADISADFVYVDSDRWFRGDKFSSPEFYPDWNPDLQLTTGYINSGVWFRSLNQFFNDASFSARGACIAEWLIHHYLDKSLPEVAHIPLVLVSRPEKTEYVFRRPSLGLLEKVRQVASVHFVKPHEVIQLKWKLPSEPLVSLVIPTKNGKELVEDCIGSILARTNYTNYEILLVDNNSDDEEAIRYFDELAQHPKVRLLKYPHPFNYSAINNYAVEQAKGDVIGLVNNDIEVIEPDWLTDMVSQVMREDIGCVGAKLLYDNDTVQHAGVVMGYGGGAGHAHKFFPHEHPGYLNRLFATHNFSAVTAACLLVTKADYDAVGGLNEVDLTVAFNDVDFCLRVLETGKRNLYCAEAVLYHHESVSRGNDESGEKAIRFAKEVDYLQTRWEDYISHDPAYNPNLTLRYENFSIRD